MEKYIKPSYITRLCILCSAFLLSAIGAKAQSAGNISFADANVKALCVANWDTNGDGELCYEEAAAVTSLGNVFHGNTTITSFDELQYFTGLTALGYSMDGSTMLSPAYIPDNAVALRLPTFEGCTNLTSITLPENLTRIGTKVFAECSNLTSVTSMIEVPFAFSSDAYNGIADNCVLSVPYGTRNAYIAAGWTEDVFKGGVVEVSSVNIVMATAGGEEREAIGYSSKYGLDFTGITDVKAYIASGYTEDGEVLLSRVTIAPPRTGLFITTDNPGVAVDVPITERDVFYANMLQAVVEAQTIAPSETKDEVEYLNFAVGVLESSSEIGFVRVKEPTTIGPNKCILSVPASYYTAEVRNRGGFKIEFVEDETTDLKHIINNAENTKNCYDLQGRKVNANDMQQGIYIINGKKVFIK